MMSQFRAFGLIAVRPCQTAVRQQTRPLIAAKVSQPVVPRRGMADAAAAPEGTTKPLKVREYEREEDSDEERPWEFDDISALAHGELDQHREIRHYARIAAYEMPRLSQLAKPFVPPTKAQPLRFRYTTYMGEKHPAESKVVLEFSPRDLPLHDVQRSKLIKLAGRRYNPGTRIVKMSCEMFEHQAQNKRYLSDLVDKLIAEAKDPSDTFEDVPFDFRHVKSKPLIARRPVRSFPLDWVNQAIEREYQRADMTGGPAADWVKTAVEYKERAAERAQVRSQRKEQWQDREKRRQQRAAAAEPSL